jgi:hypothetical protein
VLGTIKGIPLKEGNPLVMAWFRITNLAAVPINTELTWADFNEFYANDLPPAVHDAQGKVLSRGYAEWDVGGAAWHSLTVVASNGNNKFTSNNAEAITEWTIGAIGVITTVAGTALIPFTGGLSGAATAAGAAAIATAIGGAVVTVADIVFRTKDMIFSSSRKQRFRVSSSILRCSRPQSVKQERVWVRPCQHRFQQSMALSNWGQDRRQWSHPRFQHVESRGTVPSPYSGDVVLRFW